MKKALIFLAAGMLLCSCSTVIKNKSAQTGVINPDIIATVTAADLQVSERLVSANSDGISNKKRAIISKKAMEDYAVAKAVESAKADLLVAPRFSYTYKNGRLRKVEVVGYPANYVNYRKATCEDIDAQEHCKHTTFAKFWRRGGCEHSK